MNTDAPMATPSVGLSSTVASCRDLTVAYGSGEARVVALDRVDLAVHRRRDGRAVGAVWLRQDDAAACTRRARRADGRGRALERAATLVARRVGPSRRARPRDRLRVPGIESAAVFTAYENVAFAAYASGERERGGRARPRAPRARRASREGRQPAVGALRRRGSSASRSPARSHRARRCCSATSRPATSTPTRRLGCSR